MEEMGRAIERKGGIDRRKGAEGLNKGGKKDKERKGGRERTKRGKR